MENSIKSQLSKQHALVGGVDKPAINRAIGGCVLDRGDDRDDNQEEVASKVSFRLGKARAILGLQGMHRQLEVLMDRSNVRRTGQKLRSRRSETDDCLCRVRYAATK